MSGQILKGDDVPAGSKLPGGNKQAVALNIYKITSTQQKHGNKLVFVPDITSQDAFKNGADNTPELAGKEGSSAMMDLDEIGSLQQGRGLDGVALEEACAELGYSIDQVATMLRPGGQYAPELLALVIRKAKASDKGLVIQALDQQRPAFLSKIELLIKAREKEAEEAEIKIQQKIKQMGVCPMGYSWLKQGHGWRCAGGSHYLSDAQLKD
ncbi:hypothetical protein CEUSTIGMA_g1817.t1 [Chlamydomonas eustigma]|uniref:Uncharacterized protein n=1 Tax=Chlamydomonas eustigma TaxID=1157962 RepID=A0A250WU71_9CHLO|nr:hypothetical protein CEUSTIGMA_g1817.t1 [Chlamydomonas eustigma]|eukprot:GAX74368.1 hypothetical protein CEUSTIGMA_g1817.t1 [Chlamydomonas eustigma]